MFASKNKISIIFEFIHYIWNPLPFIIIDISRLHKNVQIINKIIRITLEFIYTRKIYIFFNAIVKFILQFPYNIMKFLHTFLI